jgi:hypothetical protein
MHQLLGTACAVALVALVACSDASAPPATAPGRAVAPTRVHPDTTSTLLKLSSGGIPDRVQEIVSAGFAKVSLPADAFSQSPDAVHPDVACPPGNWNGARCWLMYTPYKNGDASFENPGFLMAVNDTGWTTPPAVKNPIVAWPGLDAYNSDPDHAFEPKLNRLVQVYRVVADSFNKIMIMSTANARTWTTARIAFKERNHDAVSPSLVIDEDRSANLWYVRSGAEGCSATSSSVVMRTAEPDTNQRVDQAAWSPAVAVKLSIPNSVIWHLDVTRLSADGGYAALVVAYAKGSSCSASDLWLATSIDGITWRTYAMPVLWRGMQIARKRSISTWYRGTIRYDAADDMLHVWPSALAGSNWTIYHTAFPYRSTLGLLAAVKPGDLKTLFNAQAGIKATVDMP